MTAMKDEGGRADAAPRTAPNLKLDLSLAGKTQNRKKTWNAKNLGLRLGADAVSASSAAALVAPVISIIDR